MNWLVVLAAIPSLVTSGLLCLLLRRVAPRIGLVDRPETYKVHAAPVPYGGGLAIWAGVVLPLAVGQLLLWAWSAQQIAGANSAPLDWSAAGEWAARLAEFVQPHLPGLLAQSSDLWFLLACGSVLMVLGLIDDARKLDWRLRLVVEFLVAATVVLGRGWKLTLFVELPWLTNLVSIFWIVGLVNSINMLDNMDALAGGVAAIAALLLGMVMLLTPETAAGQGQLFVGGMFFVLFGALIGFLLHNRPPARIFMGDAGSYFVGYCLAVLTILGTYSPVGGPRHSVLAPLCVLAVPLYDTFSVVCIRLRAGRSPFAGDNNHFSHRLVALGLSKPQAVLTIYLTTAACGLGALVLHQVDAAGALVLGLLVVCIVALVAILETTARRRIRP